MCGQSKKYITRTKHKIKLDISDVLDDFKGFKLNDTQSISLDQLRDYLRSIDSMTVRSATITVVVECQHTQEELATIGYLEKDSKLIEANLKKMQDIKSKYDTSGKRGKYRRKQKEQKEE